MAKNDVIVGPDGDGGWKVSQNGRKLSGHRTQANAIEAGKAEAKRDEVDLSIQGRDGKIREKNSYGDDPEKTKG